MLSAPTRHSKVRAIKRATSLVMTKHKIQADRQLRQTDLFLKNYKLRDIATQIKTNAYFVAFRFVATPAMDISALKKALSISSATLTFIEDIHTAHFLHADQTTNFE